MNPGHRVQRVTTVQTSSFQHKACGNIPVTVVTVSASECGGTHLLARSRLVTMGTCEFVHHVAYGQDVAFPVQ